MALVNALVSLNLGVRRQVHSAGNQDGDCWSENYSGRGEAKCGDESSDSNLAEKADRQILAK